MNVRLLAAILIAALSATAQEKTPKPTPYVNVYHDDAVAFQVRHDRITVLPDGTYTVWLRWLWAEPRRWKSDAEIARIIVANVDCKTIRVREMAVLHKNREGKIFDSEEEADKAPWKSFDAKSGAHSAMTRLCEFLPKLLEMKKPSS